MPEPVMVCRAGELPPGSFRCVEVSGQRIVLYNDSGSFHATSATCAHLGGPLEEGLFENGIVTCPWHGWQFDVRTGEAIYDPRRRLQTFAVTVVGDELRIEV